MSEDASDEAPKRKKKQMRVVSDSESDDDARPRQNTTKHLSMSEDEESSDSSVGTSRRTLPALRDWSEESGEEGPGSAAAASDSSDGNSDKCPICLARLTGQAVGIPATCEHVFCAECITEWSRNVNTCPVDRLSFDAIVVRACVGGRVLQSRPVNAPSELPNDDMFENNVTMCQVCNSGDSEATMLLCDSCDEGFHMRCLCPPLDEIPEGEWYCPGCAPRNADIALSNALVARVERHLGALVSSAAGRSRPRAPPRRTRAPRRTRTRTVVTEYDVSGDAKFPIKKKTTKKRIKKRRVKRSRARTAARRAEVRATVRERLAAFSARPQPSSAVTSAPTLSLFGDRDQLEYFSEEEAEEGSGAGGTFAVARRPTASILSAYRQARRKMIAIPSPPRASTAPDLLSDIMESQTLLHSKKSLFSVTVDGKVNIKLQTSRSAKRSSEENSSNNDRVNLSSHEGLSKKAPSYPGHSGGGNWNGGYRGGINDNRGGYRSNGNRNNYGGDSYRGNGGSYNNQGGSYQSHQNNPNLWSEGSGNAYHERTSHEDDNYRNRSSFQRPHPPDSQFGRGRGYMRSFSEQQRAEENSQRLAFPIITPRRSTFGGFDHNVDALDMRVAQEPAPLHLQEPAPVVVQEPMHTSLREPMPMNLRDPMNLQEPIPMNVREPRNLRGPMHMDLQEPAQSNVPHTNSDLYADIEPPRITTPPRPFMPLPEPPIFRFMPPVICDKSEDEKSDSGLIIDTEKYDPTEPTNESGDEDEKLLNKSLRERPPQVLIGPQMSFDEVPPRPIELSPLHVQSSVLDKAVQQVLIEHRSRISSSPAKSNIVDYNSDEDSEGDCPNFSIYSATSVNIANSGDTMLSNAGKSPENEYLEKEEDLVQEDDDIPFPDDAPPKEEVEPPKKELETGNESEKNKSPQKIEESAQEKAAKEEYEERLSRKCPITPSKRNPIKIKLHSNQPLVKRNVNLYADDDDEDEEKGKESDGHKDKVSIYSRISNSTVLRVDKIVTSTEKEVINSRLTENFNDDKKSNHESQETEAAKKLKKNEKNLSSENEKNLSSEYGSTENISDDELKVKTCAEVDGEISLNKIADTAEKMTESISESEDERSYTPCLDENKSKDNSFENEKENMGLEGLDTEMISEEEGNEMFSEADDDKKPESIFESSPESLRKEPVPGEEEGEIIDKIKETGSNDDDDDKNEEKKKKRKEKKGVSKDKSKTKGKKTDITFKKLSKNSKERNYRDKDDKGKTKIKDRKKSDSKESRDRGRDKKKEKRKDMERYDVRSVVSEKKRRTKDAFGRDTSRPRSKSQTGASSISPTNVRLSNSQARSHSISKERYTPSLGRKSLRQSISRGRHSSSPIRRSPSPRGRHSLSPRNRKLQSPARRRSVSPKKKSLTPAIRRSMSPRVRKISPRPRRSVSPKLRRSLSRGRRSISNRRRESVSPRVRRKIRRSVSPRKRSISPRRRRSWSRTQKRARSRSPKLRKSKSPRKKLRRSRSRGKSLSRNRSRTPKPKKSRRTKIRRSPRRKSPKPKKRVSRSVTPNVMLSPTLREPAPHSWRDDKLMYREWSDSRSIHSRLMSPSWTPVREPSLEPQHLRVFLDNPEKSKRKEKKKRQRDIDKQSRRAPDIGPSKEVFTSGNNILVSVSFNKDELAQNLDAGVDVEKKRKRKGETKKDRRERIKKKRTEKRTDIENKKPVAIIDLEKSPFRELTPSPKNIIVLSDSEQGEKEDESTVRPIVNRIENRDAVPSQQERVNAPVRETFNTVGPKTPPEPSIKFTIAPKVSTQLRPVNPLQEDEADQAIEEEGRDESSAKEAQLKGPNTPPDPPNTPPSSPDAYDPFEPTKSGSATPEQQPIREETAEPHEKQTMTLETAQKTNLSADDVLDQRPITPIEKVMALLQSTRNVSPIAVEDEPCTDRGPEPESSTGAGNMASPERSAVTTTAPVYHSTGIPRIGVYYSSSSPRSNSAAQAPSNQRIVLPSPSKSSPLKTQPPKLFLAKPSPIKSTPIKPMPAKTLLKLPLPSVKPLPGRPDVDLSDSPYSPGSSDFGDLFEPPSDAGKSYGKSGGNDMFDSLFGSKPRKNKSSATKVPVKQIKQQKGKTQVGVKIDENNLKILDDLPSSAVEMQVKSKFLKKLNRQERVVEEVKLVLKPHYNKKHVTKEQYKDILRKAVPKICHNKTGEINPAKIQSLVEAYVKKCRGKNKSGTL